MGNAKLPTIEYHTFVQRGHKQHVPTLRGFTIKFKVDTLLVNKTDGFNLIADYDLSDERREYLTTLFTETKIG